MQNRRDLAKRETRAALVDAAIEIARAEGLGALTADAVADRAGVSRRTFFNYFPTTDAVLAVPSLDFLARAISDFEARPWDEPVPAAAAEALLHDADLLNRLFTEKLQAAADAKETEWAWIETLDEALRKVVRKPTGFDANFVGLSEGQAELACARLAARNRDCTAIGPS